MISALGSHRFNPQTGLWELVSLENVAGVEMSLPAVAEVRGVGAAGQVASQVGLADADENGVAVAQQAGGVDDHEF